MPTEHELFCKITGLQLEEGTESEVLSQLVSFQKDRLQKSGLEAKVSDRVKRHFSQGYLYKKKFVLTNLESLSAFLLLRLKQRSEDATGGFFINY